MIRKVVFLEMGEHLKLTLILSALISLGVSVSALAMTGMMLTRLWSCFMNSMSSGFSLQSERERERERERESLCRK